jgi:hypothetical protein
MKKIWIMKTNSFQVAQEFDDNYYFKMTSIQRLEIMQFLRENNNKLHKEGNCESRKRLRRFIKIIQQA